MLNVMGWKIREVRVVLLLQSCATHDYQFDFIYRKPKTMKLVDSITQITVSPPPRPLLEVRISLFKEINNLRSFFQFQFVKSLIPNQQYQ